MRIIRLTNNYNGVDIFVNADYIVEFSTMDGPTFVELASGRATMRVKETPYEIIQQIVEAVDPDSAYPGISDEAIGAARRLAAGPEP